MIKHVEKIVCPECKLVQKAKVEHTVPFWTYIHKCKKCRFIIMESDWQIADKTWLETQTTLMLKRFSKQLIKQIMSGKPTTNLNK